MIEIKHRRASDNDMGYIVNNKVDDTLSLSINTDMVKDDIDRLKGEIGVAHNKIDDMNIKALITYLERIKRLADKKGSVIEIGWHNDNNELPSSYPVQFINDDLYKINANNYIELSGTQTYININLIDVANIIAYEFIYKDLGDDHDMIEDLLKDCFLISYEPAYKLTDKFKKDGDEMYKLSQHMLIGETQYMSSDTDKYIYDYFSTKKFKVGDKATYKEVVNYSCKYAMTIIANGIIKRGLTSGAKVKLVALNNTYIDILVDNKDKFQIDNIAVHAFGRKFIVDPIITEY